MQALRSDDAGAPGMLWDRCSPAVRRFLQRALGPSVEIDDLAQEVFLRVFVRLPSLRDPSALRPFIHSVAANVLKWELRRRRTGRRVTLSVTGTLPEVAGAPADVEARHALRRCYLIFDTLTAEERVAFVLRYMEEMTVQEVAATLRISNSTAKRWVKSGAAKVTEQVARDADLRDFFVAPTEERTDER